MTSVTALTCGGVFSVCVCLVGFGSFFRVWFVVCGFVCLWGFFVLAFFFLSWQRILYLGPGKFSVDF